MDLCMLYNTMCHPLKVGDTVAIDYKCKLNFPCHTCNITTNMWAFWAQIREIESITPLQRSGPEGTYLQRIRLIKTPCMWCSNMLRRVDHEQ